MGQDISSCSSFLLNEFFTTASVLRAKTYFNRLIDVRSTRITIYIN